MEIDPKRIRFTPEQQQAIARAAEASHRPWEHLVEQSVRQVIDVTNGKEGQDSGTESALDVAQRLGLVGCFEGPSDLSTNPKYLEGIGCHDRPINSD